MPTVALFNVKGEQVGEIELAESVFGAPINESAVHQVVDMQLANRRRGTSSTKGRGEVRGGGRKPWRQKGTGRARAGTIRSPLWRGGSIVFGPKPRNYSFTVPKKLRRAALRSALSAKVLSGELLVVDALDFEEPKTKAMVAVLNNLQVASKALVVTAAPNRNVGRSARNIPGVKALPVGNLNVYDLLLHDNLVITKDAVAKVEEVLG